jgi:fructokinase
MLLGAIEAGGTKFVCATGAENGQVSDRISIPTTTPAETMTAVDDYFTTHPVDAIGIGSFGPIGVNPDDPKYGYITTTPKPGWGDFDFLGHLKSRFNIPLYWTTDVNEAAYGESMIGIAKDVPNSIYMTIVPVLALASLVRTTFLMVALILSLVTCDSTGYPGTISNPAAPTMTSV